MSDWKAQGVIDFFEGLGLPVCEHSAEIQSKIKGQERRYLKDNNNPDPAVRYQADIWFKYVTAVKTRPDELVQVVYQRFHDLADSATSAAIAGGMNKVTPQLQQSLLQIAYRSCHADDRLADRFLSDFMADKNLAVDQPAMRPVSISGFRATGGTNNIRLEWVLPTSNCDRVEILREEEESGGSKASKGPAAKPIYSGKQNSFVDSDVTPGRWYRYRARADLGGFKGADSVQRAVCLAEVGQASAVWRDLRVHVSWKRPGPAASVLVFRRTGSPPGIKRTAQELQPADSSTTLIHCGDATSWDDPDVTGGETNHYRIAVDYGSGQVTRGVDVKADVPKPPLAPRDLNAQYRQGSGKDLVELNWKRPPGGPPVEFVVVRRDGGVAPSHPKNGQVVATTTHPRCLDEDVEAGHRYSYAVFASTGELYSKPATDQPVDILAEVGDLQVQTADQTVELSWNVPHNVHRVIIRRSLSPPDNHQDGKRVPTIDNEHAQDEQLRNGQQYHYLVCCVYRPDGVNEMFSEGARNSAIPQRLPEPVEQFEVRAENQEVRCTWSPAAYGQVVVVQSGSKPELVPGQRLPAAKLQQLGDRVPATEQDAASINKPDQRLPYFSVFTVAGTHAIFSKTESCVICPDVTELRLSAVKDGVVLRWTWPDGYGAARIARRENAWPEGPQDPLATVMPVTRHAYLAAGEKVVDTIQVERARLHYVVYLQAPQAPGEFYSPGTNPACRADVQWEPWMTIRYRLALGGGGNSKRTLEMKGTVESTLSNFSGLAVVANHTQPPQDVDDGIRLYQWQPSESSNGIPADFSASISLDPIRRKGWDRFFCKALVIDLAQQHRTLIVHPNTCYPISSGGERNDRRPKPRRTRHKAICPTCFEEFTAGRIMFSSYDGGKPVRGRHSWWDRLLGRPPRPPRNERGQVLPRKVCPFDEQHTLPFTAGSQAELVLGLIGAKFSGKSHYVAALIERLQGQTGNDLDAALMAVTDETTQRYRADFYDPLFKNRLELPLTVGTPPPLIYDLTRSEQSGSNKRTTRAVTLSLYDTAGENFDQSDTVRRVLQYLRVASGVILLVDPLQLPEVREALPASFNIPDVTDPHTIIGAVLTELENGKVLSSNAPLEIPVAVVLTKADVLREAGFIEPNRLWCTEMRHVGFFHCEAHDDMSGMIGEFMQRWCPAVYATVLRRFTNHAFFAVSATGCAADEKTRRYKYISPWRVEDPLLWLLAELDVIPSDYESQRQTAF